MTLYGATAVILSDLRDIGAGLSGNLKKICHPLIADRSLLAHGGIKSSLR